MSVPSPTNLTRWRTFPQFTDGYLYIHVPDVVYKRRVNQVSFTYPIQQITYDNPDGHGGSHLDALAGYTLNVYSSAGEFKGNVRLRGGSATELDIAPTGQVEIDFANNDILEVVEERRLWVEVPLLIPDGSSYKDYVVTLPSDDFQQPPVANAGPDVAGNVDATTGLLTVTFDGTGSFAVADGATITTYVWDVDDGTITVGTINSSSITVTFPAGRRYVSLNVTDSNGAQHTAYALVAAVDGETVSAYPVRRARLGGSYHDGWEASFEVLGGDIPAIPFGAKVIFYAREVYGDTEGGVNGVEGRESIHFVGWISRSTVRVAPLEGAPYSISAQNTQAFMAFSQTTTRAASPASWFEMANLTWFRHLHYLIHWHSNLLDLMDFERPDYYASYPMQQLDAQAGTIDDQVKFLTQAVRARWTVDHAGRCYLRRWPHLMTDAEQAALDVILTLTASDWKADSPQLDYADRDEVGWVRAKGVLASASELAEYEAVAPGKIPRGEGAGQATLDSQLVTGWPDILERVARYYKLRNLKLKGGSIAILPQGIMVDPAWMEWVQWTLPTSSNDREITFTSKKFLVASVSLDYREDGIVDQSWRLENTPGTGIPYGTAVPAPGQDAPEGYESIENDGTLTDQYPLPWNYVAPQPYTPSPITDGISTPITLGGYVFAWAADGLGVLSDFDTPAWTLLYTPAAGTLYDFLVSRKSPYFLDDTDPIYGWTLEYNGSTDSLLKYSADVLAASFSLKQTLAGEWTTLRQIAGDTSGNSIAAVGIAEDEITDSYDFTASNGGWLAREATDTNPMAVYTSSVGWEDADATNTALSRYIHMYIMFGEEREITDVTLQTAITYGSPGGSTIRIAIQKITDPDVTPTTVGSFTSTINNFGAVTGTLNWSGSATGAYGLYIACNIDLTTPLTGTGIISSITIDSIVNRTQFFVSTDTGTTQAALTDVAEAAGDTGMDVDDYNNGVALVAADYGIYFASSYTGSFTRLDDGGLTGINGTDNVTAIRIPALRQSMAPNSLKSATEFIYATDGGYIGLVTFNGTTGAIASDIDISYPDYYVPGYAGDAFGNAIEAYGGDARRIGAIMRPVGGSSTGEIIMNTVDGGATWTEGNDTILGAAMFRWLEPDDGGDGNRAWVTGGVAASGGDILYTEDRGESIDEYESDFSTEVGTGQLHGAFQVNSL